MIRISGVDIPNKPLPYALRYIKGLGLYRAKIICDSLGLDQSVRANTLDADQIKKISDYIKSHEWKVEGDLKREVSECVQRLKRIKSRRGARHTKHLPVRGQNTQSNARVVRGRAGATAIKNNKKK